MKPQAVTLLLNQGKVAMIDAEDEERVRAVGKWTATWFGPYARLNFSDAEVPEVA